MDVTLGVVSPVEAYAGVPFTALISYCSGETAILVHKVVVAPFAVVTRRGA